MQHKVKADFAKVKQMPYDDLYARLDSKEGETDLNMAVVNTVCGRKLEYAEETHADTGRTNSTQKGPAEPRSN